ncbi:MAG TPA: aldehyde dehydrogenase family protein, partial [Micromonosporaceae bacterium]
LIWKVAPALAVGNTLVIKPSEISPVSTLAFAELFAEAGFPPGVVNVVTGAAAAGHALVEHPGVDKIAFTGSTNAGRSIAEAAGRRLARVSLELGGKSPNIVFSDADFTNAVNGVLGGIFGAGGQTCIAGSRVLIHTDIYDRFTEALVERARGIRLGDPLAPETEMGPVACRAQYDRVLAHLRGAEAEGAKVLCGGLPDSATTGLFIRPTILGEVSPDMAIARQEVFGPVACLFRFHTEEEAVRIANDTEFGLGAGVWTTNLALAHRMARRLRAGTVWINNYRKVSYVAPFGGFRSSGLGRENGVDSINEFTEVKTVWVDTGNAIADPFNPFA